jgi:hypothetical protein
MRRGGPIPSGERLRRPQDCGGVRSFEDLVESGEWDVELDLEMVDDDVRHAVPGSTRAGGNGP